MFAPSLSVSATSTGSLQGLDNTNGGVCRTKSMKLVLRVGQSKYFVNVCVCLAGCEWKTETGKCDYMTMTWLDNDFRLLDVECNNISSSLELLSGQIISIIYSFSWREIAVMNYLKSLIQTTGSLRPSVLSCMRSLGLAAAVNNLFSSCINIQKPNGPFLSFCVLIT